MKSQNGSQNPKTQYLFIFGNTPELSLLELQRMYPKSLRTIYPYGALIECSLSEVQQYFQRLGGTVKVVSDIKEFKTITPEIVSNYIANTTKRPVFGISWYGEDVISYQPFVREVKELLEFVGHVRFILPKSGNTLSSTQVWGNTVKDIVIAKTEKGYSIGTVLYVQDYQSWSNRDYGRPNRDMAIGMLPPKIARMAVNIASGTPTEGSVLLDPFCGLGTIIMESLTVGIPVIGSDISQKVVSMAQKNIDWFIQTQHPLHKTYTLYTSDATHIDTYISPLSIHCIATEPFMGPISLGDSTSQITYEKASNIMKGLTKLYIGCLRAWYSILVSHGTVMIAFPQYTISKRQIIVKKLVDTCEKLGYSTIAGPITYGRPYATVTRQFYLLEKNS
jgi:tRNA G10  N-methylase Trm11